MKELLKLLKNYSREKHLTQLKKDPLQISLDWSIVPIYDISWENKSVDDLPYEIITQLLDSYYCLPERVDLAFLFCWQAINNSYNELLIKDPKKKRLRDSEGIKSLINEINKLYPTKYEHYLKDYIDKAPLKVYKFIANYILKGYVIESSGFDSKYYSDSYNSFTYKFPDLKDKICKSYGEAYKQLCNPSLVNVKVKLNIKNKTQSSKIIHNLAEKLQILVKSKTVSFTSSDSKIPYTHTFSDKDVITFMISSILYASRCANFHGNVASRLNSIYSNKNSYLSNKYIFLLAHMICAISLNINGHLDDVSLQNLLQNNLLL